MKYLVGSKAAGLFLPDNGTVEGEGEGNGVSVKYSVCGADGSTPDGKQGVISADLIIGADGRHSTIRDLVSASGPTKTEYSGYIAWRGTLLETEASPESAKYFENMTTINFLKGSYIVV